MTVHAHSIAAYHEELPRLSRRALAIYTNIIEIGPGTDRDIMTRMSFKEPNQVRPRITELIQAGVVEEIGSKICPVTRKRVRIVRAKP